ncbi:MAG: hypothetical protein MK081_14175, partial [Flavobacteriales bacterium]|nr:hypothetical protein [Flavobacteriales bacterium]
YTAATGFNPQMNEFDMSCDGGGYLTLRIIDKDTGIIYSRSEPSWIDFNDIASCESSLGVTPALSAQSTTPPENYEPLDLMVFPYDWDFNSDLKISVSDLRHFLPGMC